MFFDLVAIAALIAVLFMQIAVYRLGISVKKDIKYVRWFCESHLDEVFVGKMLKILKKSGTMYDKGV